MSALEAHLAALSARFAQRAATDRAELAMAMAKGDRPSVRDIAHKLAGIGGMLGHPQVTDAALALETAAEEGHDLELPATALDTILATIAEGATSSS